MCIYCKESVSNQDVPCDVFEDRAKETLVFLIKQKEVKEKHPEKKRYDTGDWY